MLLVVSLPRNDLEMAQAAAEAGADAVKVHMNVEHRASGTVFGDYASEAPVVRRIIDALDIPVGLMPGAGVDKVPTAGELTELAHSGLDFVDIYAHHMPLWFIDLPLKIALALHEFDGLVEPPFYQTHFFWPRGGNRNRIWMCEASFMKPEDYGQPFTWEDFRRLRIFQEYIDCPMLVPTQKKITPQDAQWLKRSGSGGLMIGSIVAGSTAESIGRATREYRQAIDEA
ncbi:hypothetical protein IT575_00355 [bacterium]|nr:hypothetical protein [bacterium]